VKEKVKKIMTKEEAKLHYQDCEDIEECWEDRFLEHLTFFRTKVPVPSLFTSRLKKLERDKLAAEALGIQFRDDCSLPDLPTFIPDELKSILVYQEGTRRLMEALFFLPNPLKTVKIVEEYLDFTKRFLNSIEFKNVEGIDVKLSVIPDHMELLKEIKRYELKGILRFSDLDMQDEDILVREVWRIGRLKEKVEQDV
jgi:hypothetical protein